METLKNLYSPFELESTLQEIRSYPPLVSVDDINEFKSLLGNSDFIFHAGDCAESFTDFNLEYLDNQISIFQKIQNTHKNGTFILRGAGQFFKPRSSFYEINNTLNYFGDGINSFTQNDRKPSAERLKTAFFISSAKINYLRQQKIKIFTSHEALFIPYEECFLKQDDKSGTLYSSSSHMLWLGYRNNKIDSEQIRFLAKIQNIIGIKVGPNTNLEELVEITNLLNPKKEPYKLILILRFGVEKAYELCEKFERFLLNIDQKLKIIIDPLHGNNLTHNFQKTRKISDIIRECDIIKNSLKSFDGVSLEIHPYDHLECIDNDNSIIKNESLCDPRINQLQMAEIMHKLYF